VTAVAPPQGDLARQFAGQHLPTIEAGLERCLAGHEAALPELDRATRLAAGVGAAPGHRWRPLLVLAGAWAAQVDPKSALNVGLAVELTHTASLVLDDLPCMDDCATRRGLPATHRTVGSAGAILIALGLLGRAAELLATAPRNGTVLGRAWGRVIGLSGMSGGQAVDLVARQGLALRGSARRLHRRKTTALAAFALGAGARAGGASPVACAALERFGRDLGWAYQLADDDADREQDHPSAFAPPSSSRRHPVRLLRRAQRHLAGTPSIAPAGVALLSAFAREIVPCDPSDGC
jgi:geranylgeranyl diphosphate synthase type II